MNFETNEIVEIISRDPVTLLRTIYQAEVVAQTEKMICVKSHKDVDYWIPKDRVRKRDLMPNQADF